MTFWKTKAWVVVGHFFWKAPAEKNVNVEWMIFLSYMKFSRKIDRGAVALGYFATTFAQRLQK